MCLHITLEIQRILSHKIWVRTEQSIHGRIPYEFLSLKMRIRPQKTLTPNTQVFMTFLNREKRYAKTFTGTPCKGTSSKMRTMTRKPRPQN